jgi:NADH dehydrogenase (ubiquinone) 1 alpha subcomplex subunit 10
MALVSLRSTFARMSSVGTQLGRQTHPLNSSKMAATAPIQVAGLKATYGEAYPYNKPYPYETKPYTVFHEWFDRTGDRLNENSKIILVEGNLAVGKNSFAERLAKNFDLKFIQAQQNDTVYIQPSNNFDLRDLNQFLPKTAQFDDLSKLYKDMAFAKSGTIGRMQLYWYIAKYFDMAHALHHLLSTGQGVVLARSVFSDFVFVDALTEVGYLTKNFRNWYYYAHDNSICEFLQPHLTIYLDAPMATLKERIKERAASYEMNAPGFTDAYIEALDRQYKNKFLPKMRKTGEVLEVDYTDVATEMDMQVICEEIQTLHLEADEREQDQWHDWFNTSEDELCRLRKKFGSHEHMHRYLMLDEPRKCPEITWLEDDIPIIERFVTNHPAMDIKPGYATEFGNSTLLKM